MIALGGAGASRPGRDWFSDFDADRNRCAVRATDQGKAPVDPTHDARDVAGVGIDEARRNAGIASAATEQGENR